MENFTTYQVIARKYRPQQFKDVFGQDAIVKTLQNALRFKKVAQAYLFCGIRGTGKTTLARLFAKAINCQNLSEDFEPCCHCFSCLEIASGRSLDVIEIDGASNRGIDDIRQIKETVGFASSSGKYKIYMIDEVHMLTKEAFNALLKTLEEPPSHVKFFFATTEPHKVLPTIISRCQRFDLKRISDGAIIDKLKKIALDHGIETEIEALELIARFSEGSLRDAESLLDQILCFQKPPIEASIVLTTLGLFEKDFFDALDSAILNREELEAFSLAEKVFNSGKNLAHFLENLTEHFRMHLSSYLQRTSSIFPKEQCLYILDYLMKYLDEKIEMKRIHLEMIFLHLIQSSKRIPIEAIAKKLIDLEKQIKAPSSPPVAPLSPQSPPSPSIEKKPSLDEKEKIRHETILQFAAVELNGFLKK